VLRFTSEVCESESDWTSNTLVHTPQLRRSTFRRLWDEVAPKAWSKMEMLWYLHCKER